jgi:hypothetical protein
MRPAEKPSHRHDVLVVENNNQLAADARAV